MRTEGAAHRLQPGSAGGALALFVHGVEDRWRCWRPLVTQLDPAVECVALDMPWRAGNDYRWPLDGRGGAWLAGAVEAFGRSPDVFVGHSFGATTVLDAMSRRGCAARAAVLVAPFFLPPDIEVTWDLFDRCRASYDRLIREGVRTGLGARAEAVGTELLQAITDKAVERIGPLGFTAMFEHFVDSASLPIGSLRTPVLLVGGSEDPSFAGGRAAALAELLPDVVLSTEQGLGHACHVQHPAQLAERIHTFLAAQGIAGPPVAGDARQAGGGTRESRAS